MGLAKQLMRYLEAVSEHTYNGYFVDLFVRVSNALAIHMYEIMGYSVYRRVLGYYSGEEDAFGVCAMVTIQSYAHQSPDMRKALPRDRDRKSVVPLEHPITPDQLEW
jgi:N-terminal acetyltransferase B complex catalytic subunit